MSIGLLGVCLGTGDCRCRLGEFMRMCQYKAERVGKHFVRSDSVFPSSKRCSCYGFKLPELKLAVREWTCPKCGVPHDRDFNACLNIKQEGIRILKAAGLTVLRS